LIAELPASMWVAKNATVSMAGGSPKVFDTFTSELEALRDWLKAQGVRSVAMEATGVYWLYLYEVLEAGGLEVVIGQRSARAKRTGPQDRHGGLPVAGHPARAWIVAGWPCAHR
jgi:transposase